jgi:kynurenine 3-monooxygenase
VAGSPRGPVRAFFEHRLVGLDATTGDMLVETPEGPVKANADIVIGADGAGSAVRGQLLDRGLLSEPDFLDYGYKELTIPRCTAITRWTPARCTSGRGASR